MKIRPASWILIMGAMAAVALALMSMHLVGTQPKLQAMLTLKEQLADTLGQRDARLSKISKGGQRGLKVIVPLGNWPAEAERKRVSKEVALFVRQQYTGKDRLELKFIQVDLVADLGSGCSSRPMLDSHSELFHKRPPRPKRRGKPRIIRKKNKR